MSQCVRQLVSQRAAAGRDVDDDSPLWSEVVAVIRIGLSAIDAASELTEARLVGKRDDGDRLGRDHIEEADTQRSLRRTNHVAIHAVEDFFGHVTGDDVRRANQNRVGTIESRNQILSGRLARAAKARVRVVFQRFDDIDVDLVGGVTGG